MNCLSSQYGQGGADIADLASNIRETHDRMTGANSLDNSMGDQYANMIGRLLGSKYPKGYCSELIQKYIKKITNMVLKLLFVVILAYVLYHYVS